MASINKKIKKGRPYYYAVESQRVEGQPRIVWQKYLGTVDGIIERAEQARPPAPKETVIFEAGGVAALLGIAQRLELMPLINQVVRKRRQGPTVGHDLLLAALNRALAPCSKLAIGPWYEQTVLRRLWRFPPEMFSSQRFWDHMGLVSEAALIKIQDRLLPRLQARFEIDGRVLLYDTTNFFTFLASSNQRAQLPQRGHSKAKRHDLRQVGLALLVTRHLQIPLLHRTYPGNIPDVSLFPDICRELISRYGRLAGNPEEVTLVFDKGNVSDDAMEQLVVAGLPFVAALSANRWPQLLETPLAAFQDLPDLPGTRAFTTEARIWGQQSRVVVVYSDSFFTHQLAGVTTNLVKCQKKLLELSQRLQKWHQGRARGKRPTRQQVNAQLKDILSAQFMKHLFRTSVEQDNGLPRLHYSLDHAALEHLSERRLGRTLLVTSQRSWSAPEVIQAYRNLSSVEDAFKQMKNIDFLHWQPAYHWTDQKLQVHGFYCVLALLLSCLARQQAVSAGLDLSLPALLKELSAIREVALIYPPGTLAHRKDHITLSRLSPRQRKLAECLHIGQVLAGG